MAAHQRTMPLLCLLARLGWQRDLDLWTVRCRDGNGHRARIRVHLAPTGISLVVPSPGPVQLTIWQAGSLLPPPIRPTVAQIAQRLATSLTPKPKNNHADADEAHRAQAVA
jgi:hypothetical protein